MTRKITKEYTIEPGADLIGADLRDANLRWANLLHANTTGANLDGMIIDGPDGKLYELIGNDK